MMYKKNKKVVLAMSGGVDSSVSAWLLQQSGYYVEGLFMKNWEEDDGNGSCSFVHDLLDVSSVCDQLGIKLHTVNFSSEYWDKVFMVFLEEYRLGRTPNPDVLCNKEIKFKVFLDFAVENLHADFIATGHYVRYVHYKKKSYLLRGLDLNKDQSYFLYTLNSLQLCRCLFPVGILTKSKVRIIANDLHLVTANKRNSTGICFIGSKKFPDFLNKYLPISPGLIISVDGLEIGKHQGLMYYTLGQRKGLKIGGVRTGSHEPWYVVDKDLQNNILVVAQGRRHFSLQSIGLIVTQLFWVNVYFLRSKQFLRCTVKTRYNQADIGCSIEFLSNDCLQVLFKQPVLAVTPGQSAVFYFKDHCLGGGIIACRIPYM